MNEKELNDHLNNITQALTMVTQKMVAQEREILQLKLQVSHLQNLTKPYLIQKRRDTGES
jgi:polyhydroxyalkanoate synthesis regulator phasin